MDGDKVEGAIGRCGVSGENDNKENTCATYSLVLQIHIFNKEVHCTDAGKKG